MRGLKEISKKFFDFCFKIPDDILDVKPKDKTLIVGVGAGLSKKDLSCSPQTKAVVETVLAISLENRLTDIFFSGGYEYNDKFEAKEMEYYLYQIIGDLAQKFPKLLKSGAFVPLFVQIEIKSKNTLGNVQEIIKYVTAKKYEKVVVVDFYGHLKQLKSLFQRELKKQATLSCDFYFLNAMAPFGGNVQTRLNNPLIFLFWEFLTTLYYKFRG